MQDLVTLTVAAENLDIWYLIGRASWVVKGVMLLLVAMSIASWYIIGYKMKFLGQAGREDEEFLDSFWRTRDIEQIYKVAQNHTRSPVAAMFLAGYSELSKLKSGDEGRSTDGDIDNIRRALHKATTAQTMRLESMIPFLATTGSAAPFIGLFGTVVGILVSFMDIAAQQTATIATVAPGMAEALFATAIGLVAAIPAVMAFNFFQRKIRIRLGEMETFQQDYLNIIRRHFLN